MCMVDTFDALAKFGGDTDNAETAPDENGIATVDLSAVISRLNELENAINEIRRARTEEQTAEKNSERSENSANENNSKINEEKENGEDGN